MTPDPKEDPNAPAEQPVPADPAPAEQTNEQAGDAKGGEGEPAGEGDKKGEGADE
jgi:hypothetical protein